MIEQPCPTNEECQLVRKSCDLSMSWKEVVISLRMAQRLVNDMAAEVVGLQLSNLGGLGCERRVRDYRVGCLPSVAPQQTTDLHNCVEGCVGRSAPREEGGKRFAGGCPRTWDRTRIRRPPHASGNKPLIAGTAGNQLRRFGKPRERRWRGQEACGDARNRRREGSESVPAGVGAGGSRPLRGKEGRKRTRSGRASRFNRVGSTVLCAAAHPAVIPAGGETCRRTLA